MLLAVGHQKSKISTWAIKIFPSLARSGRTKANFLYCDILKTGLHRNLSFPSLFLPVSCLEVKIIQRNLYPTLCLFKLLFEGFGGKKPQKAKKDTLEQRALKPESCLQG